MKLSTFKTKAITVITIAILIALWMEGRVMANILDDQPFINDAMAMDFETLIHSLDATIVNDSNYYESINTQNDFVIVFYTKDANSKKMLTLAKLIKEKNKTVNLYLYPVELDAYTEQDFVTLKKKYGLESIPCFGYIHAQDGIIKNTTTIPSQAIDDFGVTEIYYALITSKFFK